MFIVVVHIHLRLSTESWLPDKLQKHFIKLNFSKFQYKSLDVEV